MQNVKRKAVIVLAVFTVFAGQLWYNRERLSRVFYLVSLAVAICAIVMFYLSYEGRKPKEREIVLVCVLCAVAVVSRVMFFMLPQFKPMGAVIIICAICFGREWGFLIGSISAFVSNFLFSQGPFTPFTMLGFGLLGYVAGLLFYKRQPKTWLVCLYGFIGTFVIYGGIVNWSSVLMVTDNITWQYVAAVFGAGLYFDLIHSVSCAFFLAVIGKNLTERLERIQKRYRI